MQLARMRFSIDTKKVTGKLYQIVKAVQLECHYSKREILAAYLNLAPYGGNIEGVGAAARIYFDKPVSALSLKEALSLAVIPQNPAKRSPATPAGLSNMQSARARLLALWRAEFDLSEVAMERFELPLKIRSTRELPYRAPHFSRRLLAQNSTTQGLQETTLDWTLQQQIENTMQRFIKRRAHQGLRNASAMLIDHRSMEVLAAIGSVNFFDSQIQGQVDGTIAKRSPGSTLKPFVYGMALDDGNIHPMSLLKDAPRRFAAYTPENFDRGFMGPIVAQEALIYSRNVPAIDLLARVGQDSFHDFLQRANVTGLKSADHYGLAAVLGGNELTMRELVALYAMLANKGKFQPLRSRAIENDPTQHRTLLSAEASFLVLDMLHRNPRPFEVQLKSNQSSVPIAWKTGTSYAFRDAWTVGVFGPYVLAVWVGNFDGQGNPALIGRRAAAPLFFEIADSLRINLPDHPPLAQLTRDLNLRKVKVCASTGDLPGQHCPHTTDTWFIPGRSPIKVSNVHRAIRINTHTGKRSCSLDPATTTEEIYEFWPSDISLLFRQAGIAIRKPPQWDLGCSLDLQATQGNPPTITSPAAGLIYHVNRQTSEQHKVALRATADSDANWLYWFADDMFIGKAPPDATLFWQPSAGTYTILAIDDHGRSATQTMRVRMPRAYSESA